jgi:hypothetical protein
MPKSSAQFPSEVQAECYLYRIVGILGQDPVDVTHGRMPAKLAQPVECRGKRKGRKESYAPRADELVYDECQRSFYQRLRRDTTFRAICIMSLGTRRYCFVVPL